MHHQPMAVGQIIHIDGLMKVCEIESEHVKYVDFWTENVVFSQKCELWEMLTVGL